MKEQEIKEWLLEVEHPAKGDRNIVELGMVKKIEAEEGKVIVTLEFSKHRDPLAEYLIGSAKAAVIRNAPAGTEVEIKTTIKEEAPKKKPGLDLGLCPVLAASAFNDGEVDVHGSPFSGHLITSFRRDFRISPWGKNLAWRMGPGPEEAKAKFSRPRGGV